MIEACAIARDIQSFDLLIEDMETQLGNRWGGLDFKDGLEYLSTAEATALSFIAVAVDKQDEADLTDVSNLIVHAKANNVKVILIAHDLSPAALHQLLRLGADDFAPYPLPDGALREVISRLNQPPAQPTLIQPVTQGGENRHGAIIPVHGLAGGAGATTIAVNLAWELALLAKDTDARVCILDLDFQFGSVASYLDLPRREGIFELLSDTEAMDAESFSQSLTNFNDLMQVFTAPAEALPLEIIGPDDIGRILAKATEQFDFVIIDMPQTLISWSETVLQQSNVYFAVIEMDMRSAQNTLRFNRALKAEDLPFEKVRYFLNRAPKFTDISAKARIKRMAENLDINIEVQFSDGGKQILNTCDHGLPISETAAKNPFRKEIMKIASSLYELNAKANSK